MHVKWLLLYLNLWPLSGLNETSKVFLRFVFPYAYPNFWPAPLYLQRIRTTRSYQIISHTLTHTATHPLLHTITYLLKAVPGLWQLLRLGCDHRPQCTDHTYRPQFSLSLRLRANYGRDFNMQMYMHITWCPS